MSSLEDQGVIVKNLDWDFITTIERPHVAVVIN